MKKPFSVLIAEDEAEIGRGLSEIVNSHPNFKVVFCAADGSEVIRYMETHPLPDVLITDIRMPGMDGLELLKYLRDTHMKVVTVIISGYSNFEYAQKAIKYGVSDYLLKPVLPEDCLGMLDAMEISLNAGQEKVFDLNIALNRRGVALPTHTQPLFLYAACMGNFPFAPSAIRREENQLRDYMYSLMGRLTGATFFGIKNGIHYLLCEMESIARAQALLGAMANILRRHSAEQFHSMLLTLSRPVETEDIYTVSSKLVAQMRQFALFGGDVVMDMNLPQKPAALGSAFGTLFVVDDHLADSIRYRDYSAFHALLKGKFEQWHRSAQPISTLLDYVKFQYVYTGQQIFAAVSTDSIPISYDWENRLQTTFTLCKSWDALCEEVFKLFADLFNAFQSLNAPRNIMREVEEYITKNYTERITNQSLARHFGFVPSYISRMFREYKGVSPCDYLTQVRIENAQRIIRETGNVNFHEISYALGFSDSSYFSKIFKKIVGMTPTEYKNAVHP